MNTFFEIIDIPVRATGTVGAVVMIVIFILLMLDARRQDAANRACRDHEVRIETHHANRVTRRRRDRLPAGYWSGAEMVEPDRDTDLGYPKAA